MKQSAITRSQSVNDFPVFVGSANFMRPLSLRWSLVVWLMCISATVAEDVVFPADSGVVDVKQAPYLAKGDGQTDDTSAIQRALEDHPSSNTIIYLRNGTYLVSDTLRWPTGAHGGVWMKRTILQGQSESGTVIKLKDSASGFQNTAETKAIIYTGGPPAQRFRNSIRNLTVDIGRGNAGASGIQYMANNQGAMHSVTVRTSDPERAGVIGLDLGYANEQGPCLIRNVTVEGFDVGIRTRHSVDSVTMEFVNVRHQRQWGLLNEGQVLSIHGLESENTVPAVKNTGSYSIMTLVDAELACPTNTLSRGAAILNEKDAMLFARKIHTRGYASAIQSDTPSKTPEPQVTEYVSHPVHSMFGGPNERSLGLPIRNTPDAPWGNITNDWISPLAFGGKADAKTDNTSALQRALDAGKRTIYLPNGNWKFDGTVRVPAGVRRIIGCEAKLTGTGTLVILGGNEPLRIERLDLIYSDVKIEHHSPRTLVISSITMGGGGYSAQSASGDLFLEDVCGGPWHFEKQNVWARQLNPETDETKIVNIGGNLWVLGLKTEKTGALLENRAGASAEILGCFAYANSADEKPPMFINDRSDLSFTMGETVLRRQPYRQVVKETRRDQTRVLSMDDVPDRGGGSRVALYSGRSSSVRIVRSTDYHFEQMLAAPDPKDDYRAWLADMRAHRDEMQKHLKKVLGDMPDPYAEPRLQWAQSSFIQPQTMMHDRYFYDHIRGRYTVRRYLKDLERRYGGIDSILLWPPMYTNLGVDNRNQFDIWRDMPGGMPALRKMVEELHRAGVKVLIPIMNWDHGTRDEGVPMARALAKLAKELNVDGLNGDTMYPVGREFYDEGLAIDHPLALEPEAGMGRTIDGLAWNVMSWGYWWPDPQGPYPQVPAVDRYKWIEPRHLTHVCDRWAHDRNDMLQYAFINGDGYESWENIFGVWNEITPRDGEALRRIAMIYRAFPEAFVDQNYEPFTPTAQPGVYATLFHGSDYTVHTLVNRTTNAFDGPQLRVPASERMRWFDLWRGVELKPSIAEGRATLSFQIEPNGFGAVLGCESAPPRAAKQLLRATRKRAHIELAGLSKEWKPLPQRLIEMSSTASVESAPEGMIRIPGGAYRFEVEGVQDWKQEGLDVQYPWENKPSFKHSHEMQVAPFHIDRTPVTCAEYKRFLDATAYQPKDSHNFLRDWKDRQFPAGWDKKPVTWVSIEDARAYAQWAGKRLPHEWEWQYAAQGNDGRLYPWGNEKDDSRMPRFQQTREQRPPTDVDAYPQGASPFGVLDMLGNVWQWTDEYEDEHNRFAIVRGGSYYRPARSVYYFPQARQLNQHGQYWLLAPCTDRSATIGFRCVMDAK